MPHSRSADVYSPREVARAAGVPLERVVSALGRADALLPHAEAVRLGRALARREPRLFADHRAAKGARPFFLAVSSTVHAGLVGGAIFLTTLSLAPVADASRSDGPPPEETHLVFIATPGPGGGGGGGGLLQPAPAPQALREGRHRVSSPLPARTPPKPIRPALRTPVPEPTPPPLNSEPLPVLVAPIITAPADDRDRIGVFEPTPAVAASHGPGQGGGAGSGTGTGVGPGEGSGVGPGSGGGTGGGPFRPGSGIDAPRLLHEVKAEYTDEARRRGLQGEVVMEIVVRRDGTVSDARILQRLGGGLDERAVQAVREWRFAPATRKGSPVDVLVEVAVEFKLR
jgi:TonB family protein